MCGIVGLWNRTGGAVDLDALVAMRDALRHRGPDDEGAWQREPEGDLALGHRRLSIVDLSPAGRQPMANEDGSVRVVFNGEIYNHEDLRPGLERRGHRFRSRCDTEVLVHLYEEEGDALVERLIGMFAFALWDERRSRLLLARDRVGIKPLYWLDDGHRFACASEIKALLPLLPRREIDPTALSQYLTFVCVPPPRTLLAGVRKLAPGSTLAVERGGPAEPVRFWDPIAHRAHFDEGDVPWEEEVRDRLERSVRRRMMSDVPVGIFLSGGVDSSANVALMSGLVDHPVDTFSVGFSDHAELNEVHWARRVAERHGTRHHEVLIDWSDAWDLLPRMVHHQDEPIADPVCVPLYFLAELAKRNGVTVAHVGEGADEVFAGYPTYATAHAMATGPWRRLRALPAGLRGPLTRAGAAALAPMPRLQIHSEALGRAADTDANLWWGGAVAFYERALRRVTTPALRREATGPSAREVVAGIAADAERAGARDELDRLIYQDLRLRLPELLLMRVDKLTMASSVEARVPFLDHELVELAMAIPTRVKLGGGEGKPVLKRALKDVLPSEVLRRPKLGFPVPTAAWFRGELGSRLEGMLDSSPLADLGYLDMGAVRRILDLHREGRADRSLQLWNVLNLGAWCELWLGGRPSPDAQPVGSAGG